MKSVPSTSTLPSTRPAFYNKKRVSPPTVLAKRPASRRSPAEPVAAEVVKHSSTQMSSAERDLKLLLEPEYQLEVKAYMYDMELRTLASVDLIDQQPELQWYMRPYLVDFLIEIHQRHRLRPETLYLALNIVDRYVSKRIVFKKHYQLVGCASLWIAAKFEDAKDRVPTVLELCQMCDHAYDESAFIQMEGHVLSTINWIVGHPTAEAWLRLACVTGGLEKQRTQHIARFVMEITLFHKEFIPFKPSEVAMASLLLARFMLGEPRRVRDESEPVITLMQMLNQHLTDHLATVSLIIVKKYCYAFYSRASTFVREYYLAKPGYRYVPVTSVASTPLRRTDSSFSSGGMSSSMSSCPSSSSSSTGYSSLFVSSPRSVDTPVSSPSSTGSCDDDDDDHHRDIHHDDEPYTPGTVYSMPDVYDEIEDEEIPARPKLPFSERNSCHAGADPQFPHKRTTHYKDAMSSSPSHRPWTLPPSVPP